MKIIKLKNMLGEIVNIRIVDKESDASFITHNGTFHADEVMASIILLNKFGNLNIYRTNTVTNKKAFIYDIGFGEFDHHGIDFDEKRENGIKYASCGLIWKKFASDIAKKLDIEDIDSFKESIDKNLIMDIDRDDNGQMLVNEPEIKLQNIPNLIGSFNPSWNDVKSESELFLNAISFANEIFNNIIRSYVSKQEAKKIVEQKIEESKNGILLLDNYMPWKDIVLSSKDPKASSVLYAIFPSKRGGYNIVATPESQGSFIVKKEFPKAWAGKENDELQKISGIKSITFCHKNLFICACKNYDDALKIAKIAVNNKEN